MNLGHLVDRERADPAVDWNLLSLAEKQQLGVARVLLKSPSFAVLDEATSAMDAEVESELFEKLKRSGITLVTVTHRASLLRFHEKILTIKGGRERSWSLKAVEAGDEEGFASPRKTPVSRSATSQTDKDAQAAAYLAERSKSAGKGPASSAAGASRPLPEVSDVRKAWMVIKLCVPTLSLADETVRQFIVFVVLMGAGTWIQTGFLSSTYGILRALAMESDLQKYVAFQGRIVSMRLLSLGISIIQQAVQSRISITWRERITKAITERYIANGNFYFMKHVDRRITDVSAATLGLGCDCELRTVSVAANRSITASLRRCTS